MDREQIWKRGKTAARWIGTACLLLVPCASYVLFELVTGNLAAVPSYMAALNIGWIYVLYTIGANIWTNSFTTNMRQQYYLLF